MKTSTIILQTAKCCNGEKPQRAGAGRVLRYLLFIFMFLQIFVLYSCAVGFRTPRHGRERNGIIIEGNDRNNHHDAGRHNDRNEHYDYDDHH